jgi:hypothetical protein
VTAPGAASNFIKLPPIAFLPGAHTNIHAKPCVSLSRSAPAVLTSVLRLLAKIGCSSLPKGSPMSLPAIPQRLGGTSGRRKPCRGAAPRYCKTQGTGNFPCVMFQTRYCGKSFAERASPKTSLRNGDIAETTQRRTAARTDRGGGLKQNSSVECGKGMRSGVHDKEPLLAGVWKEKVATSDCRDRPGRRDLHGRRGRARRHHRHVHHGLRRHRRRRNRARHHRRRVAPGDELR